MPDGIVMRLAGYRALRAARSTSNAQLYVAVRELDATPVVLKRYLREADAEVTRARREFELLQTLDSPHIPRPHSIEQDGQSELLCLPHIAARSLERQLGTEPLELGTFLDLSIQLCAALETLHRARVLHRCLNPENILVDLEQGKLWLVEFDGAGELGAAPVPLTYLALPYISPEQTGRTSRGADVRSDLYSLGCVFYRMLTGATAFSVQEPLEWVHAHLARRAPALLQARPELPGAVCRLVDRLLEKSPEARYQCAAGVLHDLQSFRAQLDEEGLIDPEFRIGQGDRLDRLRFPRRLYGRERELGILHEAYTAACRGRTQACLLTGPSGIGKSALADALRSRVAESAGYWAHCKFDVTRQDRAYAGFAHCLEGLAEQLLIHSEARLSRLRGALLHELGAMSSVIVQLAPRFGLILGPQPAARELPPLEATQRLAWAARILLRVVAQPAHPLALSLDDVQWADPRTLRLLTEILSEEQDLALLVIASFRAGELSPLHPLRELLEQAHGEAVQLKLIAVQPLTRSATSELLADLLESSEARVRPLAERLGASAGHNPFLIRQILEHWQQSNVLRFADRGGWDWDMRAISECKLPDNLGDLVSTRIERLPKELLSLLEIASCIGDQFDAGMLIELCELERPVVEAHLAALVDLGLIVACPVGFQFAHDRVRETAQTLHSNNERADIHYRIASKLIEQTPFESLPGRVIEIVEHLNRALQFVPAEQHERVIDLNALAAKRALRSGGAAAARRYLAVARALLRDDQWESRRKETFSILLLSAHCAYLNGDVGAAEALLGDLQARQLSQIELARVRARRSEMYNLLHSPDACVDEGLAGLRALGVRLPKHPSWLRTLVEIYLAKWSMRRSRRPRFERPPHHSPRATARNLLFYASGEAAFEVDTRLAAIYSARIVRSLSRYGGRGIASSAISALAHTQYPVTNDLEFTAEAARFALELETRCPDPKTHFRVHSFITPWLQPRGTALAPLRAAERFCVERGINEYVHYSTVWRLDLMFFLGIPLPKLIEEFEAAGILLRRYPHFPIRVCDGALRLLHTLTQEAPDEDPLLPDEVRAELIPISLNIVGTMAMMVGAIFGRHAEVLALADELANTIERVGGGMSHTSDYVFYAAFAAAACPELGHQPRYRRMIRRARKRLTRWARRVPENFAHQRDLLAAECARQRGQPQAALSLYARAANAASALGLRHVAALALERRGLLCLELKLPEDASLFLDRAQTIYADWGAVPKAAEIATLLASHEQLAAERRSAIARERSSAASVGDRFDLESLMQAASTIAEEVRLDRVLERFLHIALENAGAERAVLLLRRRNLLVAVAESSIVGGPKLYLDQSVHPEEAQQPDVPRSIVAYVERVQGPLVLDDASEDGRFIEDRYVRETRVKSVLCLPIVRQSKLIGILYLENILMSGAFAQDRVELLRLISSQAAISLDNARLYQQLTTLNRDLERRVEERTLELRAARDAAESATRAKSDFLASMSHEIRTPLNVVLGMTQILGGSDLSEDQRDCVQSAHLAGSSLLALINDILDFSKIEAGRLDLEQMEFSASELVEDVLELLATRADQKGIELFSSFEPELPLCRVGDAARVKQILINFANNAIKFTDEGFVEIFARASAPQTDQSPRPGLRLGVRDTGIGISENAQSQLFQSFRQVDASTTRRYGGTGLGLAIARRLAEVMGGSVGMESEPGRGSTFWCDLPLEIAQREPPSDPPSVLRACELWILTDSSPVLHSLFSQLSQLAPNVRLARTPEELPTRADSAWLFTRYPAERSAWTDSIRSSAFASEQRLVLVCSRSSRPDAELELRDVAHGFLTVPARTQQLRRVLANLAPDAAHPPDGESVVHGTTHAGAGGSTCSSQTPCARILVAEDYPLNQKLVRKLLERAGYACEVAGNGLEALEALERHEFDLVLADCQMPEMDGYQFTRELRQREARTGAHLPVIAMTANTLKGDRERCLEAGMDDYISKPLDVARLYSLISSHLKLHKADVH